MLIELTVTYHGYDISLSNHEIFGIARQEVLQKINDLTNSPQELHGNGNLDNPIRLSTIDEYFIAAYQLHHIPNQMGLIYYDISHRLIACDKANKYMTDWGGA